MDRRLQELTDLKAYIDNIDKETTLFLQSLQWDYKNLTESKTMAYCKYITDHRIPMETRDAHEKQCYLTLQGYTKDEVLLPDPINPDADTVIKLSKQDIMRVISAASASNPSFKRVSTDNNLAQILFISMILAPPGAEPLSAARLQQTYSADERRVIHDAVVSAAPACHDLTDLALPSTSSGGAPGSQKSRMEILAELRNMKRRRTKYRVASKTANYSDTLRDVIRTQMELYAEAKGIVIKTEYGSKTYVSLNKPEPSQIVTVPTDMVIKQERVSPESDYYREASNRHRKRSRSRERPDRPRKHDDRETGPRKRRHHFGTKEDASDKRRHKDYSQDREEYSSRERRRFEEGKSIAHRSSKDKNVDDSTDRHYSKRKHKDIREPKTYESNSYAPSSSSFKERNQGEECSRDNRYTNNHKNKVIDYKTCNKDFNRYREQKDKRYHDVNIKEGKDGYYEYREQKDNKRYHDVNVEENKHDYYDNSHDRKKRKRHS